MPLSLALLAVGLAVPCVPQSAPGPAPVPTQVRSAALFENGLAFVLRSGRAPAGAAQARIDALPVPTHGTFWISTGGSGPALALAVARKSEIVGRVPATKLIELLQANVGRDGRARPARGHARRGRERNAATFWSWSYDKVTVHGKRQVKSHERESVRLEIRKRIEGEVTRNPGIARVEALAEGLIGVNPRLRLSWSVALEAGKSATIEYEYTLYVPS